VAQQMVELVFCSQNKLSLATFTAAVNLGGHGTLSTNHLTQGPLDILRSCEDMVRRIRGLSGGLLEVVQPQAASHSDSSISLSEPQTQAAPRSKIPRWLYEPLTWAQYAFTRQHVQLIHQTAKEFINDSSNWDLINGDSSKESVLAGHLRLTELYMSLARIRKPR
jgi:hypothetical protein